MTPTAKLRFVEREIQEPYEFELHKNIAITKKVRILQQWWAVELDGQITPTGEWRDVPVESK